MSISVTTCASRSWSRQARIDGQVTPTTPISTTYAGSRATPDRRLRPSAAIAAVAGPFRAGWCGRGLRRESLSPARREVPRSPQFDALPDLPQRARDVGLLGVRRATRPGVRVGAYHRGDLPPRHDRRRILRPRRRGVPDLQLEPSRAVIRCRSASALCPSSSGGRVSGPRPPLRCPAFGCGSSVRQSGGRQTCRQAAIMPTSSVRNVEPMVYAVHWEVRR